MKTYYEVCENDPYGGDVLYAVVETEKEVTDILLDEYADMMTVYVMHETNTDGILSIGVVDIIDGPNWLETYAGA